MDIPTGLVKLMGLKNPCPLLPIIIIIIIIIGIQPLGWFGQRPEPSQATGMALVRCILGKFLGVVCHCFPPRLDVPLLPSNLFRRQNTSYSKYDCN